MQINKLIVTLFAASVLFCSCASSPKFSGRADIVGHVCGEHGENVQGYIVSIGIGKQTITDSSGNFVFEDMRSGSYILTGYGKEWSSARQKIEFRDKRMITYLQIESADMVYKKCEQELSAGDFSNAQKTLSCLENGNRTEKIFCFYKGLASYCSSPSSYKKKTLGSFIENKQVLNEGVKSEKRK